MRKLYNHDNKIKDTNGNSKIHWFKKLLSVIKTPPATIETPKNKTNQSVMSGDITKKAILIYVISFLVLIAVCVWDIYTINEVNKLKTYQSVTQDFTHLNYAFKDLESDDNAIIVSDEKKELSQKAIKDILYLSQTYLFIDAFYLVENKKNKSKKGTIIHDFQVYNNNVNNNDYTVYSKQITKDITQILKHHKIKQSGFYYFDILAEKSAFYIIAKDNTFIFIRLNQDYLSDYYITNHNMNIFFKNQKLEFLLPDNKFSFNMIKNIEYLSYEEVGYGAVFKLIFYFLIFLGMNWIAVSWYRNVCVSYISDTKITMLENELTMMAKNKSGSENRIQHLVESSNLVPWTASPETNTFTYIGEQIVDITNIAYEGWFTSGFWLSHIHEEDRHLLFKAINELKGQRYVTIEYRIYDNVGNILWLRNTISQTSYYNAEQSKSEKIIFQGFLTDITDQKKVFETLENARLTAEKASQMKSNFLASMSHELRTPLNSIIGFADIIRTVKIENNESNVKEYANNILFSGKHLLDLINDILDYSKIEAGEFEIRIEPTPVVEIFKACQTLLQNRADKANISLFFKFPEESLMMNVDPVRIKQVLINLLTNAIKFNRPDGKVALVYEFNEHNQLVFKVTDTGIGMKPEDLKVALEKFRQVDSAKNRNQEGTGLGLSISKSLIELHGGQLSIKSIYGKGTQVSLTFPAEIIYIHDSKSNIA